MPKKPTSKSRGQPSSSATSKKRSRPKSKSVVSAKGIKLRSIRLKNFKLFDDFKIDFPGPRMKDDPDIVVMGSENGLGKTTVLEACSILFLGAVFGKMPHTSVNLLDLMIRAGAQKAILQGNFIIQDKTVDITVALSRDGRTNVIGSKPSLDPQAAGVKAGTFLSSLGAYDAEPLLLPPLMYFHSYRKVHEGNPELGTMVEASGTFRQLGRVGMPLSTFKMEILRSMMSREDLFEGLGQAEAEIVLTKLNELMVEYADGRIEKLRPSPDNSIEFRITPADGGPSFTFDGLSSGQKEIISTLFLIWKYTREQPGIILIDEPELHLNAEWHRRFIRHLHKLAPENQYIIATHSEDIAASVDKDHRVLLEREG